jgi:hypothetical protein
VLDVSEHGVRIELEATALLADSIRLFLTKDGSRQPRCQIAWRSGHQIGLCYLGPIEHRSVKVTQFSSIGV